MPKPTRPQRNTRVRSKRLDELNASQLALAVWLIARQIVEDETERPQAGPEEPPSAHKASGVSDREAA